MNPLELRPLSFGELLDAGFKLFTKNFKAVMIIGVIILVPLGLIGAAFGVFTDFSAFDELATDPNPELSQVLEAFSPLLGLSSIALLTALVGGAMVQAAVIRLYAASYQGHELNWRDSLRSSLPRLLPVIGATLLVGLGSGLGLILCLVPGVWLWVSWYTTVPAMVAEHLGPIEGLKRSFKLVRPRFWTTLGIGAVAYLLASIVSNIVSFAVQLASTPLIFTQAENPGALPAALGPILGVSLLASVVVEIFTLPFLAAVATAVYFDLRVRTEGYDLELMASELALDTPLPPGLPTPTASPDDPFGLD